MFAVNFRTVAGSWLGILLVGCSPVASERDDRPLWEIGEKQKLVRIGPGGRSFITAFDRARGQPRLVMVLSPT